MKNLFIAISPSHIENCEILITSNTVSGYNILLNPGNYSYDKSIWDEVILDSINLSYRENSFIKKISYQIYKLYNYKKFVKKITKRVNLKSITGFYYFNLDDVLSNHLYYLLGIKNNVIIEDGILNYYFPKATKASKVKKNISKVFQLNYNFPTNHPTNIDSENVVSQFVRIPEKAIYPEKSKNLPIKTISFVPKENLGLIIGQDIMSHAEGGLDYYKLRLNKLCSEIKKTGVSKVVYKPHRNGDVTPAKHILPKYFTNIEFYEDNTPIETCVSFIQPEQIFSFESSAMLNLKLSLQNESVKLSVLPYFNKDTDITKLYRKLGIKIF